jgi:hypothetical protein
MWQRTDTGRMAQGGQTNGSSPGSIFRTCVQEREARETGCPRRTAIVENMGRHVELTAERRRRRWPEQMVKGGALRGVASWGGMGRLGRAAAGATVLGVRE